MLQKGDIVQIDKGFTVTVHDIPEIYYKGHHPYSKKLCEGRITIGIPKMPHDDERELKEEITKLIKFAFAYHQMPVDGEILRRFINHQIKPPQNPAFLVAAGKYIVTHIEQVSTVPYAYLETYDADLPLRRIEIAANYMASADRHMVTLVGQDLGWVSRYQAE